MTQPRPVSNRGTRGDAYDRRFIAAAAAGADVHGEAVFMESLGIRSVLDAGCGTGRVAIELARRGLEVVGVDLDAEMVAAARRKAPDLEWHLADLATVELVGRDGPGLRRFDAAVLAGNVMIFLAPGTEADVIRNLVRHLRPGGLLVSGFQLLPGGLDLARYDGLAHEAGLVLTGRFATWDREAWTGEETYAVSVHCRPGARSTDAEFVG
jgi:SAM-dependent methyltransferase